jgi:TolB protein
MKPLTLAIFLCVTFFALTHAAPRKIAYEHRDDIFVADIDGTHQKKIAAAALPEISPDGTRVAFNTDEDSKRGLAQNATSQSPTLPMAKSRF